MNKTTIFNNNLKKNSSKTIGFNTKKDTIGNSKYLPAFSKEWKNTVYSFDKYTVSNLPVITENVNKILKSYFNLFFKNHKTLNMPFILLKRRRNFVRRIFTSDAEIKHTNDKVVITLYTLNREKKLLKYKYFMTIRKLLNYSNRLKLQYYNNILKLYNYLNWKLPYNGKYVFTTNANVLSKKKYLKFKFENLNKLKQFKHLLIKKIWSKTFEKIMTKYYKVLGKHTLLYSLNQSKFNKLSLLSTLNTILKKIFKKKIEYNIINLKYFTNNPDIFTNVIALKLKGRKIGKLREVSRVLNRTKIPKVNTIQERTFVKKVLDQFKNKYKDLRVISNSSITHLKNMNLNSLLGSISSGNISSSDSSTKNNGPMIKDIYNSIKYKNIGGIRIEVKGRLTPRYRADRSVYSLRWKGGLKNIDSSFQRKNTILWRGNVKSNTAYSISTAKRRVGAFAVKGWIGGK